jgi:hypothetical protein
MVDSVSPAVPEELLPMIKSRRGAWFIPSVQIALAIKRAAERKK